MASGFVRPAGAVRWLGKTCRTAVQGGEVTAGAALAVGKHALPIPPCRNRFALFILCQVEPLPAPCCPQPIQSLSE